MVWQRVRFALLAAVVVAAAALPIRAEDEKKPEPVGAPKDAPKVDSCPTQYRTICEKVMVPEEYQCNVTTYKVVNSEEKYTAYKTVCVEEKRTVTVNKMVAETKTVPRTVTVCVPTCDPAKPRPCNGACTQAGACLTRCKVPVAGAPNPCPPLLLCRRITDSPLERAMGPDGVCLPVNQTCSSSADCSSAIFDG